MGPASQEEANAELPVAFMVSGHFWKASDFCLTCEQAENGRVEGNGYVGGSQEIKKALF